LNIISVDVKTHQSRQFWTVLVNVSKKSAKVPHPSQTNPTPCRNCPITVTDPAIYPVINPVANPDANMDPKNR